MIIIIQAAANGVFIKQDTSDECHVFEKPNRAPSAAAKLVRQLLQNHFDGLCEEAEGTGEEGEESADAGSVD
jgi:hypothetical protein